MSLLDRAVSLTLPLVPKPLVRHFSRPYIAGTSMADAFDVVRRLRDEGAMTTLDILGEFIRRPEEADANAEAYRKLLRGIAEAGLQETHVSVKLTALGLSLDVERCYRNMRSVLQVAAELDNFVRIDMEDSACTTPTLQIYRRLRGEFPGRVGAVIQSYLRRSVDDVAALLDAPSNFRLCKGIYIEPRTLAYRDREIVRRNFTLLLEQMFEGGAYVGIATHDEQLVWEALRIVRQRGLAGDAYEFQMLLGVDEELRRILIDAGHRLRVYVPYGEHWYSYSVRRLRENPQIAGYAFKAIFKRA